MGIIQAIKKGTGLDGYAGNFLGYISCWLSMYEEVRVTRILREGNGPADFMAVGGPEGIIVEYVLDNLPSRLKEFNEGFGLSV